MIRGSGEGGTGTDLQDTLRVLSLWFKYGSKSLLVEKALSYCVFGKQATPELDDEKNREVGGVVGIDTWLQVITQIIARIDQCSQTKPSMEELLNGIGRQYPQLVVFPLTVASQSHLPQRQRAANRVLAQMREESDLKKRIISQAGVVSRELIRVAILWNEQWHEALQDASRLFFTQKDIYGMYSVLKPLHTILSDGAERMNVNDFDLTPNERQFINQYGKELKEALAYCNDWENKNKQLFATLKDKSNEFGNGHGAGAANPPNAMHKEEDRLKQLKASNKYPELNSAWDLYYLVFRKINKALPHITSLRMKQVSPRLAFEAKELDLAVPGTVDPNRVGGGEYFKEDVKIRGFAETIQVINSKQRPKKLMVYGSDGKEYMFLLKGHEDLRQDERVMQLFSLINTLLALGTNKSSDQSKTETKKPESKTSYNREQQLYIRGYAIIPLSPNSGLIEWVDHHDTLHALIREYRENRKIKLNKEHFLITNLAPENSGYDLLNLVQKLELFEEVLSVTESDDLAKLMYLKSGNSEVWLTRRINYTRSLAVMSMVGYVLGLGDRHPSNLMIDKKTGGVTHIDFGDCFEVAMHRNKFPEKVPFRLTRMLTNAMEISGIEGNFRTTAEKVMRVLRLNRDSLMAVLDAFVHDPLLSWRLVTTKTESSGNMEEEKDESEKKRKKKWEKAERERESGNMSISVKVKKGVSVFVVSQQVVYHGEVEEERRREEMELVEKKAVSVLNRVEAKLTGKDFRDGEEALDVTQQVELLIEQATSHERLCQSYMGWCPFW
eukprot:TRINITY_DN1115_c0_g2_i1.p1 TRINITY_DN1115_c0_g2~~TRINITY_DN1115_c0_g2_i1.p1  ORF type:complete len:885 (-),score=220.88 TRINITY_DN1115_c0_g2_i1:118-2463(-)